MWLWIKQEIFKTEAPKKLKGKVEVSKSMTFVRKNVQIDEEVSIKGRLVVQQSEVGKVSERNQVKRTQIKGYEINKKNKKSSSVSSDSSSDKSKKREKNKKFPKGSQEKQAVLKGSLKTSTQAITPEFVSKSEYETLGKVSEVKFEKKEEHKLEEPAIQVKPMEKRINTPKLSQKSSPKYSLTQKSIIVTADKPKTIEKSDPYLNKRSGPPTIRYKKSSNTSTIPETYITDFDYDGEESLNSNLQDFPSVSKDESKRSSFSKSQKKTRNDTINEKNSLNSNLQDFPSVSKDESKRSSFSKSHKKTRNDTIHEKNSESSSSSSRSKSSSINPIALIKSRIALSENSLLELKKVISDVLVPKNQSASHNFSQKKYKNGNLYIGELKGDLKDGRGKLVFNGGDIYEGEWKNDKQHGRGKMIWSNGANYIGFFDQDQKSGIGEYVWPDGACYMGEWRDNQFYGYGRYRWTDGRVYNGLWETGIRQGFGVLVDKNGNKYEGEFQNDKMHGEGVLTKASGEIVKGIWTLGKLSNT